MKSSFAIAVCNFTAPEDLLQKATEQQVICQFLPLVAGDRVCVLTENEGWCYGSKLSNRRDIGLFPANHVKYNFELEVGDSTTEGISIVKEIYQAVHIWWNRLKDLYAKQSDVYYLDEVLDKIDDLLVARKKILSGGVPEEELNNIRMTISKKMDRVNLLLSLSVTIREENGVPYDPERISVLQNYKEHLNAEKALVASDVGPDMNDSFSVMLSIQSLELTSNYNCEINFSIIDAERRIFVSETVSFLWKGRETKNAKDLHLRSLLSGFNRSDVGRRLFLLCRIVQIAPIEQSSTLRKNQDLDAVHSFCRQVYAWSFVDLTNVMDGRQLSNESKERLVFLSRTQDFDQAFKSLAVTMRVPSGDTNADDVKMTISTQLYNGSANEIRQRYPHLFTRNPPLISNRTDVSANLDENRNFLYFTLATGELTGKSSDRNIEARIAVLDEKGNIISDSIEIVTSGECKPSSEHRSLVYYHQDKPCWMEQLKIRLPEVAVQDLHIHVRISLFSRKPHDKVKADKGPFALAYFHILHNSTLVKNEEHELLVYKIDNSQYDSKNVAYLGFPSSKRILRDSGNPAAKPSAGPFSLSEKSIIKLSTSISSSILSQNEDVVNILRWRSNPYNLANSLINLSTPVGETENEMIRFLCPLLDALFEIWVERLQLELSVFDVIISLYRLVEEHRNVKSVAILKKYMDRFSFPTAALKLLSCLNHYIESASTNNNEKTRNSLKVMGRIFITVVCSKKSGDKFGCDPNHSELIHRHIESVLASMVSLMSETRERMAIQNTALKHLPSIINPILGSGVFEPIKLCNVIIRVLDGFGKNIVARERVGFVGQLIETELFEHFGCRQILLPKCISLLLAHLDVDIIDDKEYPERAQECAQIIANLIERLFPMMASRSSTVLGTDEELNLVIESLYRPVVKSMVVVEQLRGTVESTRALFFALILAMLNKMSAQIFDNYLRSRPTIIDKMDFVVEMVQMIRDLLSKCPFPSTWQQMIMIQNKTIHKSLRFIMSAIQSYFASDHFSPQVWEEYMITVVCFVTQPSLQINEDWIQDESDPKIVLRKTAAKELRSVWFMLSTRQKMEYIPRMVGPFLKVALIEDEETRDATIPIFFDMMQAEFHANMDESAGIKLFSDELISQLDYLVNENFGSRAFQEKCTKILTQQCQSDKDLWNGGGRELIMRIDQLLKYLFEYRQVCETEDCPENGMSRTFQLMRYYEQFGHTELYIMYIYKLYEMHLQHNNDIEAAKTLLLHANLLSWDNKELPEWLVNQNLTQLCSNERQLKDRLLCQVAELFSEGQMWEDSISILKELVPVYEKMCVDYSRLALLLERIAAMYRKINGESRLFFHYYLVGFFGKGFPSYLNGQRFVFRSNNLEQLSDFLERMKQIYGGPETIPTMDDSSELASRPGRHIQVFSVDPICSVCPFEHIDVNPYIKDYYRHYNINNFEYSRLLEKRNTKWTSVEDTELMRTWIVKTRIVTYESLPSLLRFSQVLSTSNQILISPLRRSVDQMERKNEQLKETALLVADEKADVKKLSLDINGVVRANVQGGIRNYEVFFTDSCSKIYEPEEKQLLMRLSGLIVEQVEILGFCLYAHSIRSDPSNVQFHEHLVEGFYEHKRYVEDRFGQTRSIIPPGGSIHMQVIDRDRKRQSGGPSIIDLSSTSTGTLKSRGASISFWNMLSPVRKNTNSQGNSSSSLNATTTSETLLNTGSLPNFEKQYSFSGPMRLAKIHPSISIEGVPGTRIRTSFTNSSLPPPLPPRPLPSPSDSTS